VGGGSLVVLRREWLQSARWDPMRHAHCLMMQAGVVLLALAVYWYMNNAPHPATL
jgi:hypothetical protein